MGLWEYVVLTTPLARKGATFSLCCQTCGLPPSLPSLLKSNLNSVPLVINFIELSYAPIHCAFYDGL